MCGFCMMQENVQFEFKVVLLESVRICIFLFREEQ
jgi:hypothetical protein